MRMLRVAAAHVADARLGVELLGLLDAEGRYEIAVRGVSFPVDGPVLRVCRDRFGVEVAQALACHVRDPFEAARIMRNREFAFVRDQIVFAPAAPPPLLVQWAEDEATFGPAAGMGLQSRLESVLLTEAGASDRGRHRVRSVLAAGPGQLAQAAAGLPMPGVGVSVQAAAVAVALEGRTEREELTEVILGLAAAAPRWSPAVGVLFERALRGGFADADAVAVWALRHELTLAWSLPLLRSGQCSPAVAAQVADRASERGTDWDIAARDAALIASQAQQSLPLWLEAVFAPASASGPAVAAALAGNPKVTAALVEHVTRAHTWPRGWFTPALAHPLLPAEVRTRLVGLTACAPDEYCGELVALLHNPAVSASERSLLVDGALLSWEPRLLAASAVTSARDVHAFVEWGARAGAGEQWDLSQALLTSAVLEPVLAFSDDVLGLVSMPNVRWAMSGYPVSRGSELLARRLSAALVMRFGGALPCWHTFGVLADEWDGSLRDVVSAALRL